MLTVSSVLQSALDLIISFDPPDNPFRWLLLFPISQMRNLDLKRESHIPSRGRSRDLNQRTLIPKLFGFYHYPVVITITSIIPPLIMCSRYPAEGSKAQKGCVTCPSLFWQSWAAKPVPESSKSVLFLLHLLKTKSLLSCFLQKQSKGEKGPRGVGSGVGRGEIIAEAWKLL